MARAIEIVPAITNENIYLAKSFVAPKGTEVDTTTEEGRSLSGFMLNRSTSQNT